jgi:hypothetical protein
MGLKQFDLAAIAEIDAGRIAVAFNHALRRCESDCLDRPGLKTRRTVTLTVALEPVLEGAGGLDSVNTSFSVAEKCPKRDSTAYNMKLTRDGLAFNELSPEDVDQMTFELDKKKDEKKEDADAE